MYVHASPNAIYSGVYMMLGVFRHVTCYIYIYINILNIHISKPKRVPWPSDQCPSFKYTTGYTYGESLM